MTCESLIEAYLQFYLLIVKTACNNLILMALVSLISRECIDSYPISN